MPRSFAPPGPTTPPPPPPLPHPHHHPHLHNPLDAAGLAGHKRAENLLTYLVLLHLIGAAWLAWRYRALLSGGGGGGEGGGGSGADAGRPPHGRRGTRLRRVASSRANDDRSGPAGVSATFSFADLTGVSTEGGEGGAAAAVGGVRRAPSRGTLGRRGV
jgi:hypothetical protein